MNDRPVAANEEPGAPLPTVLASTPRLRVVLSPPGGGSKIVDLTAPVTQAIAHEIWKHTGGNSVLNWLQAEAILHNLARLIETDEEPVAEEPPQLRIAA